MMSMLSKAAEAAQKAAMSTAGAIEERARGVRDAALDTVDTVKGAAVKVVNVSLFLADVGITIAVIVAPIPTLIGAALLWLFAEQAGEVNEQINRTVSNRQSKRQRERAIALLKKYGRIPETATISTGWVDVRIDSRAGQVTGKICKGEFKGRSLDSLSTSDLDRLIEMCPDTDTRDLLEGYRALRVARSSETQ